MSAIIVVALIITITLGAVLAIVIGYYLGSTRDRARFEKSLRELKEASEHRLLEVQEQQHTALRDARDETARFRDTIELPAFNLG